MTEKIYPAGRILSMKKKYNAKQFLKFTEDKAERYELIEGKIYMMASPSVRHQHISMFISTALSIYFKGRRCRPFYAPLDVVLFEKEALLFEEKEDKSQNVFQPDIFVVCDPDKIGENRINGAPDFVAEIVSQSNSEDDYIKKLGLYMKYGVREYWIVSPMTKKILVYVKTEQELDINEYTFKDKVKAGIFEDLEIDFNELK